MIGSFLLLGCGGADPGGLPAGQRLVTGRLAVDDAGPAGITATQLVALFAAPGSECPAGSRRTGAAAADVSVCAIFGEPFDPDGRGDPFRLLVPCDRTVNLLVQTLGDSGGQSPGDALAVLAFPTGVTADETTTLLAREPGCRATAELATVVLDLGELAVSVTPLPGGAPRTLVVGGPDGGQNPLATVDTDGDFTANAADPDDDEDAVTDADDQDRDGDGQADAAQTFAPAWLDVVP